MKNQVYNLINIEYLLIVSYQFTYLSFRIYIQNYFRFELKTHPGQVEYHRFCNLIEGAFVTLGLDKNTYLDPNEYLTSYEGLSNYLTDEQRRAVDSALNKLRSKPNIGLDDLFKDYDKHRQGIVSKQEFLCALTVRKLNMLLSIYEVKCLAEAFSKDDRPNSFNYRAFMKTIDS